METETVVEAPSIVQLRKEIRDKTFYMYRDNQLKDTLLVDVESIRFRIQKLEEMGGDITEYSTYIRDLLLTQIDRLTAMLGRATGRNREVILFHLHTTRETLWPTKN